MWQIPDDENIQNKWYSSINEFHNSHSNRRFKSEYYTLKNKMLSFKTKQAIEEIDTFIDNITSPITIDGVEYDNLLSESEYRILMDLRK
jgi:esterase/lipase